MLFVCLSVFVCDGLSEEEKSAHKSLSLSSPLCVSEHRAKTSYASLRGDMYFVFLPSLYLSLIDRE